jgi:hypothetical protein
MKSNKKKFIGMNNHSNLITGLVSVLLLIMYHLEYKTTEEQKQSMMVIHGIDMWFKCIEFFENDDGTTSEIEVWQTKWDIENTFD